MYGWIMYGACKVTNVEAKQVRYLGRYYRTRLHKLIRERCCTMYVCVYVWNGRMYGVKSQARSALTRIRTDMHDRSALSFIYCTVK